jgi:hypothetical protein
MIRRVLVCGGRDFNDAAAVFNKLDELELPVIIIHGAARGADTLAQQWADERKQLCLRFPADWNRYGRAAGIYRNTEMLEQGEPDLVVAFPGGRGTENMIRQALACNIKVERCTST